MQTTSEFNITELSLRDFKKLLTDIKDKETFESNLLKQVKLNIDFWSYLLIYDDIVNEGNMIVSEQLLDHAADIFLIEWYEIQDEQISLAQFVLDKLEYFISHCSICLMIGFVFISLCKGKLKLIIFAL